MKKSPIEIKELILDNLLESSSIDVNHSLRSANLRSTTNTNELTYVNSFGLENNDSIYIFKNNNKTILASSDDELTPIIGIFNGEYDENNIPENFKDVLDHYAYEIEEFQKAENNLEAVETDLSYKENWKTINPLIPYTFGQGTPYNFKLTPTGGGQAVRVKTGCNNTAMAQILAYWGNIGINGIKYRVGCNGVEAYTSKKTSTSNGRTITEYYECSELDPIQEFDYDNIIEHYNKYYNDNGNLINVNTTNIEDFNKKVEAISQMMQYIGFICGTSYGSNSSSTITTDTLNNAKNFYFNVNKNFIYAKDTSDDNNVYATNETFETKIYNELINKRPILFFGFKSSETIKNNETIYTRTGGHAFICDGYNAETDSYHFNWGWDGLNNGWFKMTLLNPKATTNTTTQGGYNYDKYFIGNLYPKKFIEDITKGDYNGDGKIDIHDVLFFNNLIDTNNIIPIYDRNGDGYVDLKDISDIIAQLDINKTYELAVNDDAIFDNSDKNAVNYIHNKINLNKRTNKIEFIIEKKTNDNVTSDIVTLNLPKITNLINDIINIINGKSLAIRNKFNSCINSRGKNTEDNVFVYFRNNKSNFVPAPDAINNIELIDLGLPSKTKWANMNIGAKSVEDVGNYYSWGEIKEKQMYSWNTYAYYDSTTNTVISLGESIAKNKSFDVAYSYNNTLCIPTAAQWQELINNCTWTKTTKNDVNIWEITGPNGNIIYLPVNGCIIDNSVVNDKYKNSTYYWTANNYSSNVSKAQSFKAVTIQEIYIIYKRTGVGIRAVSV